MLGKPLKVLSYSALIAVSFMGNVTTSVSYFDDDESFSAVASHLLTGWEFSFSKAFATCGSGSNPGVCPDPPEGYPEEIPDPIDPIETIEVPDNNPPAPEPEPWTGTPEPDPQPTDPDGGNTGGGGGSGTGGTPSTPPVVDPVTQCKLDALEQKNADYRMADNIFMGTLYLCNMFKLKPAIAVCSGAALWAANKSKAAADARYLLANTKCNTP